jgi:hypothetical protein
MDLELIKNKINSIIMHEITHIGHSKHWEHANRDIYAACFTGCRFSGEVGIIDDSILEIHGEEIRKAAQSAIDEAFIELKKDITNDILVNLYPM